MVKDHFVEPEYLSYLLRLRRVRHNSGYTWRASLAQVSNGEQHNFASLKALFGYLEMVTRKDIEPEPEEGNASGEHEQASN